MQSYPKNEQASTITVRDAVSALRYYDRLIALKAAENYRFWEQTQPTYYGGQLICEGLPADSPVIVKTQEELRRLRAERQEWQDFLDAARRSLPTRSGGAK